MPTSQSVAEAGQEPGPDTDLLVLGVDTCGPTGSVALARLSRGVTRILGQTELAGRSYSEKLVAAAGGLLGGGGGEAGGWGGVCGAAAGELLAGHGAKLAEVAAIVVVSGPGSFTGVRVGLSAVKGLAEPGQIPVVAVSRLAVLAAKAGVGSAVLDAHRHEVFLRVMGADGSAQELLAGAEELAVGGLREGAGGGCAHSGAE